MHSPQEVAQEAAMRCRSAVVIGLSSSGRPASVLMTQYGQRKRGAPGNSTPAASSSGTGRPCRLSSRIAADSTAQASVSDSDWYSLTTTGPAIATTCTLEAIATRFGRSISWRART
jgi:hypothetical protein